MEGFGGFFFLLGDKNRKLARLLEQVFLLDWYWRYGGATYSEGLPPFQKG